MNDNDSVPLHSTNPRPSRLGTVIDRLSQFWWGRYRYCRNRLSSWWHGHRPRSKAWKTKQLADYEDWQDSGLCWHDRNSQRENAEQ